LKGCALAHRRFNPNTAAVRDRLVALAARHELTALYELREFVI